MGGMAVGRYGGRLLLGGSGIQEWEDVWVIEVGGDRDLAQKTISTENGSKFRTKHFDCDLPFVLQVRGEVDGCHPSGAEFAFDGVAVG